MKKKLWLIVITVLIASAGGTYYLLAKEDGGNAPASPSQTSSKNTRPKPEPANPATSPKPEKACDVLTQETAQKVLGDSAKAAASNNDAPKDSDHLVITTCTYNSVDNAKIASLLMRVAKDAEGSAHDKEQFGPNKPVGAQDISGYGDTAYWDVNFKQLNVLKGSNWYVITSGSSQTPERTLDQAKQLADLLAPKL